MYDPTPEQEEVLCSSGRVVKVAAFAGAGKSSTLLFLANRFPKERFLYIAFNRSVVIEAQGRFPSNTMVVTGHGMAYRACAGPFKERLTNSLRAYQIVEENLVQFNEGLHKDRKTMLVDGALKVLTKFMSSTHMSIDDMDNRDIRDRLLRPVHLISEPNATAYVDMAHQIWNAMTDPEGTMPFVHDAYVKMYQLQRPHIEDFTVLLLDEAQDSNPVLLDIIERQQHMRRFYIGDNHQSIYGFRNACNAMQTVMHDQAFNLTGSFRFGPALANVANVLLRAYKGEEVLIRGLGAETDVREASGSVIRPNHAYVARTNSGIFEKAAAAAKAGHSLRFIGGVNGYKLNLVLDAFYFFCGKKPFSDQLRHFDSFQEMKQRASDLEDMELTSLVNIVLKMGTDIPEFSKMIKDQCISGKKVGHKEITLVTAHKSKGLEFDHGEMTNDFAELYKEEQRTDEEVNLIYVAATRFMKTAYLPERVTDAMAAVGAFK